MDRYSAWQPPSAPVSPQYGCVVLGKDYSTWDVPNSRRVCRPPGSVNIYESLYLMYVHIHVCVCVCGTHTHTHTHIRIHTHKHTHTHTHTHTQGGSVNIHMHKYV